LIPISFGFEISSNYKITKWWDIQPAIDFLVSNKGLISVQNTNTNSFDLVRKEVNASFQCPFK
jgi:hypothetical protein